MRQLAEIRELIRELLQCPTLQIHVQPAWGAGNPSCRPEIRKALSAQLGKDLGDLSAPPSHDEFSVSIAHCQLMGGYALVEKPAEIGFDVEDFSRVDPRVVARITSQNEVASAPSAAHLWSAQESAYKGLRGFNQPRALSQVEIFDWQEIRQSVWKFNARVRQSELVVPGQGVVFTQLPAIFALFCRTSST